MAVNVTGENYEKLKGFGLWLTEQLHKDILARLKIEERPRSIVEMFERQSMSRARKSVQMLVGDILEETEAFSLQQVETCDDALRHQSLPTLTEVRAEFGRKVRAILKRGRIRNETEFYALRNVVEALPEDDREHAWSMLDRFTIPKEEK